MNLDRYRSPACWLAALLGCGALFAVFVVEPRLRYRTTEFDSKEVDQRTTEVQKRAAERKKRLEQEREKQSIPRDHAERLADELERRYRQPLEENVRRLAETFDLVEAERQEKMTQANARTADEMIQRQADALLVQLERTVEHVDQLTMISYPPEAAVSGKGFGDHATHLRDLRGPLAKQMTADLLETLAANSEALLGDLRRTPSLRPDADQWRGKTRRQATRLLEMARSDLALRESLELTIATTPPVESQILPDSTQEILARAETAALPELYQAARDIEDAIHEATDDIRATDLATREGISIDESQAKIAPTDSNRPDLPELESPDPVTTVAQLDARRRAAQRAVAESNKMVAEANSESPVANRETPIQLAAALSPAMQARLSAAARSVGDLGLNPSFGSGETSPNFDREGASEATATKAAGTDTEANRPGLAGAVENALPGRRISDVSERRGWLYLDTWYVIGPWENHGDLLDMTETHPPETEINLEAVYPGKLYTPKQADQDRARGRDRGHRVNEPRNLRWRFLQSDSMRIVMPDEQADSTYYLYTDVFSDRTREMLIAVGSDDAAKIWINGKLAWHDQLKSSWNPGEHFKKVTFQEGYNDVLVRLENGGVFCVLSVLICPPEPTAP